MYSSRFKMRTYNTQKIENTNKLTVVVRLLSFQQVFLVVRQIKITLELNFWERNLKQFVNRRDENKLAFYFRVDNVVFSQLNTNTVRKPLQSVPVHVLRIIHGTLQCYRSVCYRQLEVYDHDEHHTNFPFSSLKNENDFIPINRRTTRPGDLPSIELLFSSRRVGQVRM